MRASRAIPSPARSPPTTSDPLALVHITASRHPHGRARCQHARAGRRRAERARRSPRHQRRTRDRRPELHGASSTTARPGSRCSAVSRHQASTTAFYRPKARKFGAVHLQARRLGKVNTAAHHGYYDKEYLFADVAVIGGGPAGVAAALQAADAGAEVIVVDDGAQLGGL